MYRIAKLTPGERQELFIATAAKMKLPAAMIEKDFWVCLTLDYLFHRSAWKQSMAFKGGTSLSKAYDLIKRFSEDIDLILDWRVLGYKKDEPWNERSNTKQLKFLEDAKQRLFNIVSIYPYAAQYYPSVFLQPKTNILTTTAERSFWEKATILHQEAFRPENSRLPSRYSRHYYDLYSMAGTPVRDKALSQPDLLEKVANFKMKFYPRGWAHYELAKIGTLKLMPAEYSIPRLKDDYAHMKSMIYGNYPSFEEILHGLSELEKEINA